MGKWGRIIRWKLSLFPPLQFWHRLSSCYRSQAPHVSNDCFPSLPTLLFKMYQFWNEWIFTFLLIQTSVKSHYPFLLPCMSHNGRMTAREGELQGKGMNIFKIVLFHLSFSYCSQNFWNETRGETSTSFSLYWFPNCRLLSMSDNSFIKFGPL